MTHDRLKIYFRHMQLKFDLDQTGNEVNVIVGYDDVTKVAKYVAGNVPQHNWQDMTRYTDGLNKLQLSWNKVNQSSAGTSTNQGGSNYDKGISASLEFFGPAFTFIWDWLCDESWQVLNAVEVQLFDALCGKAYRVFEIKADNLRYSTLDECRFEITLREQDELWHSVHKTFIWDDWQGWFNSQGNSTKAHPTFRTCIDPRPRILQSVRMGLHMFLKVYRFTNPVLLFLTDESTEKAREILGINKFCPAPLVRDILVNYCDKFGYPYDTMFTDPALPYYNLCLYFPASGGFHEDNSGGNLQNTFLFDNRWDVTIAEFLDKLRPVFEAEWYVTPNNTLVFKPTKELLDLQPIYDFTATGSLKILNYGEIVYTFNGDKKAAYGRYEYMPDGSDLASQEVRLLYNDLVDYDGPALNPMLEGEKTKTNEFAATGFYRDGRSPGYIKELITDGFVTANILMALLVLVSISLIAGVLSASGAVILGITIAALEAGFLIVKAEYDRDFVDENRGMVRITSEQTMSPRLLLWDGQDINTAGVVRTQNPAPNLYYNTAGTTYPVANNIGTDNAENYVYNYPMYFDSLFAENLYDRYHDSIDNPLKSLENNQSFELNIELCCEALDIFGVWDRAFIRIGYLVKLESRAKYGVFGRIEAIQISYSDMTLNLKGKVIKKKK